MPMNKTFLPFTTAMLLLTAMESPGAETLVIFKAAAALPVTMVIPGHFDGMDFVNDVRVSKTLKGDDLVNLAMGRSLGTKVDKTREVLALALADEGPGDVAAPTTRVIVYNPDPAVATDPERIKATIFTLSALSFDAATISGKPTGQGIGTVAVTPTPDPPPDPAGDATKNALLATSLDGAAIASATLSSVDASITGFKVTLKGLGGAFHFKYTDAKHPASTDIDGILISGMFTTTGKPLKTLSLP